MGIISAHARKGPWAVVPMIEHVLFGQSHVGADIPLSVEERLSMRSRLSLLAVSMVFGVLLPVIGTAATHPKPTQPVYGYGRCHQYKCSCFGFQGSGYTCTRGGCGHHYDLHY